MFHSKKLLFRKWSYSILNDSQISSLLNEKKILQDDYRNRIKFKRKRGHKESELYIRGESGSLFILKLRQSSLNPLDFSIILSYLPEKSSQAIRLRRYNGKSHEHTNKLEGKQFYDFHIHTATERYQSSGLNEDAYAETTNRYASFEEALECMLDDYGFIKPNDSQVNLF